MENKKSSGAGNRGDNDDGLSLASSHDWNDRPVRYIEIPREVQQEEPKDEEYTMFVYPDNSLENVEVSNSDDSNWYSRSEADSRTLIESQAVIAELKGCLAKRKASSMSEGTPDDPRQSCSQVPDSKLVDVPEEDESDREVAYYDDEGKRAAKRRRIMTKKFALPLEQLNVGGTREGARNGHVPSLLEELRRMPIPRRRNEEAFHGLGGLDGAFDVEDSDKLGGGRKVAEGEGDGEGVGDEEEDGDEEGEVGEGEEVEGGGGEVEVEMDDTEQVYEEETVEEVGEAAYENRRWEIEQDGEVYIVEEVDDDMEYEGVGEEAEEQMEYEGVGEEVEVEMGVWSGGDDDEEEEIPFFYIDNSVHDLNGSMPLLEMPLTFHYVDIETQILEIENTVAAFMEPEVVNAIVEIINVDSDFVDANGEFVDAYVEIVEADEVVEPIVAEIINPSVRIIQAGEDQNDEDELI